MKIGPAEVDYVAQLANLAITEEEKQMFVGQLSQILEYVEQLDALDTSTVEPTTQIVTSAGSGTPMRTDEPRTTFSQEDSLWNGPETGAGHFKVPQVIAER
jgi:aspartyl-tRNA(Asn)/glutamyl-tRNA(Gln) amidotransferase subunit C